MIGDPAQFEAIGNRLGFQIAADPVQAGTGLLIVVLGLPVYHYWHAHH